MNIFSLNQHIFCSSQLHISTIYGHHQAGQKNDCVLILYLVTSLVMTIQVCATLQRFGRWTAYTMVVP